MTIQNSLQQQKQLNQRIFVSLVFLLIMFGMILAILQWQNIRSAQRDAKLNAYHLTSINKSLALTDALKENKLWFMQYRIDKEKHIIAGLDTKKLSTADMTLSVRDQLDAFRYEIEKIVGEIDTIQALFADPEFITITSLLKMALGKVLANINKTASNTLPFYQNIDAMVEPLASATHQFQLLHQHAHEAMHQSRDNFDRINNLQITGLITLLVATGLFGIFIISRQTFHTLTELITTQKDLLESEKALSEHRDHLEDMVVLRTRELEEFSYSLSHDLRTPLRGIDGFSHILLEEYAVQLDERGQNYLKRIRKGVQRMGDLINDILQLSLINRQEITLQSVNLSTLAQRSVDELKQADPERQVEIQITPDLQVTSDPRLMRMMLDNLLGNAWKFSSKTAQARIEFGCQTESGETVYFVRDNGCGFEMRYVDKLFQVFQRLHHADEYPGTGVGLSIVARLIKRLGGSIRTESEPGKGASFYFTLNHSEKNEIYEQENITG